MNNYKFNFAATFILGCIASTNVGAQATKTPSAPTKNAASVTADPLKKLAKQRDEMRGITWYQHPSSPKYRNANGIYVYFGKNDNGTFIPLRLSTQYFADNWLFVKKAWAKADGVNVDIPEGPGSSRLSNWERDNGSGDIWEWTDAPLVSAAEKDAVRRLSQAKSVTIRFEGRQYYNDRKIAEKHLKAMREVIGAYEAATGKAW